MTESTEWNRETGRTIDRLVTVDPRRTGYASVPDLILQLYRESIAEAGQPLTYAAARAFVERLDPHDYVVIITGAGASPWYPHGETDGPPGALGIAHALSEGLEARPILVTESRMRSPLEAAAQGLGLLSVSLDVLNRRDRAISIQSVDPDTPQTDLVDRLIEQFAPEAIVAVERIGPNREGQIGQEVEMAENSWVEPLIERASRDGILTIGVGDRGNEIGFGRIEGAVNDIYADSDNFTDIACRVSTDHLVVGGTSNWGAYGVEAMIALMTDRLDAMHTPDREARMLINHAEAGSVDALSHRPDPTVDGTSLASQRGTVALLRDLVSQRLSEHDPTHMSPIDR